MSTLTWFKCDVSYSDSVNGLGWGFIGVLRPQGNSLRIPDIGYFYEGEFDVSWLWHECRDYSSRLSRVYYGTTYMSTRSAGFDLRLWRKSTEPFVKANFDAGFYSHLGSAGAGGNFKYLVSFAKDMGFRAVEIEGDSLMVISKLEGNGAAYLMEKEGLCQKCDAWWVEDGPQAALEPLLTTGMPLPMATSNELVTDGPLQLKSYLEMIIVNLDTQRRWQSLKFYKGYRQRWSGGAFQLLIIWFVDGEAHGCDWRI
ncbi:hypothetical protein Gogos_010206 [Gossypium gossypioides]|uniref:RNase H type-1 domain-containing protein n=1 Tax=Gossypium gossypioides TaxID=34282 RepID=A0A7J9BKI7_GOSGO|nr:hypothetical protein [Gossypium gossypioides]